MKLRPSQLGIPVSAFAIMIYLLFPVVIVVILSFSSARFLTFPPPGFSLQWYDRIIDDPEWVSSLFVSLKVGFLAMVYSTLLGVPAAFALSRYTVPMKAMVNGLIVAALITPTVIRGLSTYLYFVPLGLVDTISGLAYAHTVSGIPYVVINVIASLRSADRDLERAAIIHGASPMWAVMRITLPIIAPGIMVGAIFAFVNSMQELLIALFILGGLEKPLAVKLWVGVQVAVDPRIAATSSVLIGLAIIAFMCAASASRMGRARRMK